VLKAEGFILGYDIRLVNNRKMLSLLSEVRGRKRPIIKGLKRESVPDEGGMSGTTRFPISSTASE